MLFSAQTGGFYDPAIHQTMPEDAVEISDQLYADLIAAQESGSRIGADAKGQPIATARPKPTAAELLAAERAAMVCSRFQARAALMDTGLLADIELAVGASGDPFVQLAWAEAQEWRRDSPALSALAAAIGLSAAQIDDLFRAAMQIRA